eukprot:131149-Rhodomonas_salina.1
MQHGVDARREWEVYAAERRTRAGHDRLSLGADGAHAVGIDERVDGLLILDLRCIESEKRVSGLLDAARTKEGKEAGCVRATRKREHDSQTKSRGKCGRAPACHRGARSASAECGSKKIQLGRTRSSAQLVNKARRPFSQSRKVALTSVSMRQ